MAPYAPSIYDSRFETIEAELKQIKQELEEKLAFLDKRVDELERLECGMQGDSVVSSEDFRIVAADDLMLS